MPSSARSTAFARTSALVLLVLGAVLLTLAGAAVAVATGPARPARIEIEDAPFTRNPIVHLTVVPDPIAPVLVVLEVRVSNDPTTLNGVLVNGLTTSDSTDWTLLAGPDGLRTVYAQLRYAVDGWSPVASATITLDQSPGTSTYFDVDAGAGFYDASTGAPEPDWHERSTTPTDRIFANAIYPPGGANSGFVVSDLKWGLVLDHVGSSVPAGTYAIVATPYGGGCAATCVTISLGRSGRSCSGVGSFVIHDIVLTDDLEVLDADYRLDCSGAILAGSIRYGSSHDVTAFDQTPERYQFGSAIVGETSVDRSVTYTNVGTAPSTFGQATVDPSDYTITSDNCSRKTISVGATCAIGVRFAPASNGHRFGVVAMPDGTARGSRYVRLLGDGFQRAGLDLTVDIPATGPGTATAVVTMTPAAADGAVLFVDGGQVFGPTETIGTSPSRREDRYRVPVTPGPHHFEARYQAVGGYFVYADPKSVDVVVPDAGEPWGLMQVGLGEFTTSSDVVVSAVPTTGLHVSTIALSNDGVNWTERTYSVPQQDWTLSPGDGLKTVYLKWREASTPVWSPVQSDTIILDTVAPVATAPATAYVIAPSSTPGLMPIRLGWSGSDATSGIDHYLVDQWTDGVAAAPTTITAASVSRNLAAGHSYRFAVRAVDLAGNTSLPANGSTFRLSSVQQSSSAVVYHGTWATSTSTIWWGGTARSSSTKGSTVSYTFTGRSIAWVGLTASNRGKAYVYINGVLKAAVDLYSPTTLKQRVVWAANYSTSATRTITIKVVGTSGRPRVDVDGFVVGS